LHNGVFSKKNIEFTLLNVSENKLRFQPNQISAKCYRSSSVSRRGSFLENLKDKILFLCAGERFLFPGMISQVYKFRHFWILSHNFGQLKNFASTRIPRFLDRL